MADGIDMKTAPILAAMLLSPSAPVSRTPTAMGTTAPAKAMLRTSSVSRRPSRTSSAGHSQNLGAWNRVADTLKIERQSLGPVGGGGQYLLEMKGTVIASEPCASIVTTRILKTDRNGREVQEVELFRGRGIRDCGDIPPPNSKPSPGQARTRVRRSRRPPRSATCETTRQSIRPLDQDDVRVLSRAIEHDGFPVGRNVEGPDNALIAEARELP